MPALRQKCSDASTERYRALLGLHVPSHCECQGRQARERLAFAAARAAYVVLRSASASSPRALGNEHWHRTCLTASGRYTIWYCFFERASPNRVRNAGRHATVLGWLRWRFSGVSPSGGWAMIRRRNAKEARLDRRRPRTVYRRVRGSKQKNRAGRLSWTDPLPALRFRTDHG